MKQFLSRNLMLSLGLVAFCGKADEWTFPKHNCAITPPQGWQTLTNGNFQPSQVVTFTDPERKRFVIVLVDTQHKPVGKIDEKFISDFERGVEKSGGGKRTSGKVIEVAGLETYDRIGFLLAGGRRTSTWMQTIPTDRGFYVLEGLSAGGKADEDPEIRESFASFRFLNSPVKPRARSPAYQMGYKFGYYGAMSIPIAVVLGLIIFVIVRISARRDARRREMQPPPLPPR